jgi:beta-galactosidase
MVVAPALQMVSEQDVKQMETYAQEGGHLVLTCRTGLMDRNGQLFEGKTAQPILSMIGGEIEAYDSLPQNVWGQVEFENKKYAWGVWGDLLYANPDTKVLAKYADQFYSGGAAVTQHKFGSGAVTYCGVHGEAPFVEALMERLAAQLNLRPIALPARVHVVRRGPYRILLNYQDTSVIAPAPSTARFIIGTRTVEPAGVAVWEQATSDVAPERAPEEAAAPARTGLGKLRRRRT